MDTHNLFDRSPTFTRVVTTPGRAVWWLLQRTLGRVICYIGGHIPSRTHTPSQGLSESDCLICGKHEEMETKT